MPDGRSRRKACTPRRITSLSDGSEAAAGSSSQQQHHDEVWIDLEEATDDDAGSSQPPAQVGTPLHHLLVPRFHALLSDLSRLSTDLILMHVQRVSFAPHPDCLQRSLELLTSARHNLLDAFGSLGLPGGPSALMLPQTPQPQPPQPAQTQTTRQPASNVVNEVNEVNEVKVVKVVRVPVVACVSATTHGAASQQAACAAFQPKLTPDGKCVVLSDAHPGAILPVQAYRHLADKARGLATLHLRALLKHFFSQETLANSSRTGAGVYKRALDSDIVLGVYDHIRRRYPGMTQSKMHLCCTDVCVQARRRWRRSRTRRRQQPAAGSRPQSSSQESSYASSDIEILRLLQ